MLICINGVAAKSFCCRRKSFDHLIGNGESSTTNKADKFPPLHCRPRHKCTGQTKQSIWRGFAYVRFGSEADTCSTISHVRFTCVYRKPKRERPPRIARDLMVPTL